MSYVFHCSKCKFAHAGECAPRKPQWRFTTNFAVPRTHEDSVRHAEWVATYFVGDRKSCEVRLGRPICDGMSQACDDPGQPEAEGAGYPMGGLYIPFEVWVEWQLSMGVSRETAEERAIEPPLRLGDMT